MDVGLEVDGCLFKSSLAEGLEDVGGDERADEGLEISLTRKRLEALENLVAQNSRDRVLLNGLVIEHRCHQPLSRDIQRSEQCLVLGFKVPLTGRLQIEHHGVRRDVILLGSSIVASFLSLDDVVEVLNGLEGHRVFVKWSFTYVSLSGHKRPLQLHIVLLEVSAQLTQICFSIIVVDVAPVVIRSRGPYKVFQ